MRITSASDMNGDTVNIGTEIKVWLGGSDYTEYVAVVTGFEHYQDNVVRVTAVLKDGGGEIKAFSDAIARSRR
jgi:hypothetical protein